MNNWYKTKKIHDNLYMIQELKHWEQTNMYFFVGEKYNLLVDTGTGIQGLKEVLLEIDDKPIHVITTHIHWDHIGNHNEFDFFYVHEMESTWLENGVPLDENYILNQMTKGIDQSYINNNIKVENFKCFKTNEYTIVSDGDILDLGNMLLQIFHTPGHSPGHLMFYDPIKKILLTGDTCYEGDVFCNYESTDPKKLYESYKKIINLDIDLVLPSHGKSPTFKSVVIEGHRLLKKQSESNSLIHGYGKVKGERISFIF